MDTKQKLEFVYRNEDKFCATYEQHEYVHEYDPTSILGDAYYCVHCDDFQVG